MHTCRNATVACFVGRKTRGALIFRWRSSFHPSRPHPDRKLRVLIVQYQGRGGKIDFSRKNERQPRKWTTPLGIRDVSRWIVWEMKEKKNLNISSIISVSTRMENRWSGICCLTKNVGKMFWKFQNGKRWMRMMKLTMKKKNSEFF